ncbi:MAG: histidine kinase, partial [Comamonas sp.]|nr:histidine kinase [Comamonas sp.]
KRSEIGLPEVRKALNLAQQWHSIPDAPHEVQSAINAGVPLAEASRGSSVVRELAVWADALSPQTQEDGGGFLNRLFRRA